MWRSLPDDRMITLTTFCQSCKNVDPDIVELVTVVPNSEQANQIILNYVIFILTGDQQMLAFCDLMQKLINNPALSKVVSALRLGMQFLYV